MVPRVGTGSAQRERLARHTRLTGHDGAAGEGTLILGSGVLGVFAGGEPVIVNGIARHPEHHKAAQLILNYRNLGRAHVGVIARGGPRHRWRAEGVCN